METFVINLKHRTDRYNKITKKCSGLKSIKLKKFEALHAADGEPKEGMKYCGLSHQEIIRQNMHLDQNLLVFEDDCNIINVDTFDKEWTKIKSWLDEHPDKWDIFNGGPTYVKPLEILDIDTKLVVLSQAFCTHFMYYNKKCFNEVLKWDPNTNIPVDEICKWGPSLKVVTSYPFLATQYDSFSDIENEYVNYRKKFRKSEAIVEKFVLENKNLL